MGDTISLNWQVASTADDPEHEGYGQVKTDYQLVNQDGKLLYDGNIVLLVRKKSAPGARLVLKPGTPWEIKDFIPDLNQPYCIEDFPIGEGRETEGRTITEADVVNFAGLTGDWDPQYVDAEFAWEGVFGERIAHSLLAFNAAQGLWSRDFNKPLRPATRFAGHVWDKVTFLCPVKIGDTIFCRYRHKTSRISRTKPEVGLLNIESQTVNQRGEVVQEAEVLQMIASREGARKAERV
jgi:acyl dehydratase